MAGFYPNVPDNRMAYHLDGTRVYVKDTGNTLTQLTAAQIATMNDEDGDGYAAPSGNVELIFSFPEPRDVRGYFFVYNDNFTPTSLRVSSDTTNLLDGTWTSIASPWTYVISTITPNYRSMINTVSAGNVKALSFGVTGFNGARSILALHLYGFIPLAQTTQRLIFWDPTLAQQVNGAHFDWGDVVQGTSYVKTFRIKNNSPTLTANSIVISSATETFAMAVEFSTNGTTYTPTINIGNLAPDATSAVLYVRRPVPAAEPLRLQASRFQAVAGSWT